MNPVFKMLQVLIGTLALFALAMAGMALAWPDVSLVRQLGCFDSYGPVETFLLLPIQSHPLAFAIGSGAVIGTIIVTATASAWQDYQARRKYLA